jgi:hypothetical protein
MLVWSSKPLMAVLGGSLKEDAVAAARTDRHKPAFTSRDAMQFAKLSANEIVSANGLETVVDS